MPDRGANLECQAILAVDAGAVRHGRDWGEGQRRHCAVDGEEQAQGREDEKPFHGYPFSEGVRQTPLAAAIFHIPLTASPESACRNIFSNRDLAILRSSRLFYRSDPTARRPEAGPLVQGRLGWCDQDAGPGLSRHKEARLGSCSRNAAASAT